jgi:hypothetical protein
MEAAFPRESSRRGTRRRQAQQAQARGSACRRPSPPEGVA